MCLHILHFVLFQRQPWKACRPMRGRTAGIVTRSHAEQVILSNSCTKAHRSFNLFWLFPLHKFTAPSASVDAQPTSSGLRGTDCAQSAMFAALLFFQSQLCALGNTRTHHSIRQAMFCVFVTPCFPNGAACMQFSKLALQ
jgi:hypothetical protein